MNRAQKRVYFFGNKSLLGKYKKSPPEHINYSYTDMTEMHCLSSLTGPYIKKDQEKMAKGKGPKLPSFKPQNFRD